jgi:spermidine synthase
MVAQEAAHDQAVGGRRASGAPRAALALIGFTAIIAQIVLMRELIVVFYGNEISLGLILANWLLWTAFGSGVLGRLAGHVRNPRALMAGLQGLIGVVFPATILVVRASKNVFRPTPGEILGPGPMFLTSLVVLGVLCSLSGLLFAAGSRAYARHTGASTVEATSSVYLLEAAGSGVGGLLASLVLIRCFDAFEIASLVSILNFVAAVETIKAPRLRRAVVLGLLAVFAFLLFPFLNRGLEKVSLAWLWRGFQVVATRNSIYGNLVVVKTEGTRSLYENGLVVFSVPNLESAEEAVHFALLQHPAPRSLLLIGGGVNGSLAQALQHSTLERVDYVEMDPAVLDLARSYFPQEWTPISSDPRVRTHPIDGRLFLKTTRDSFDVIILNLPDPQTAQLNRFYTDEFFREVAAKLTPAGVFSFQLRAAEDYISPELADFLRCIKKTLSEVFPEVTFIPGGTVHFFAAEHPGLLATSPQDLLARLQARHLRTRYVREYYIPFRMMPDRMLDLDLQIRPLAATPVNRDFTPVAYYFDVALWSTRFNRSYRHVFQSAASLRFRSVTIAAGLLLLAIAGTLRWLPKQEQQSRSSAGFCVAATGFTLMGLEMLLLLGFQAIYGYVYHQLAIVIAAFMVGMAVGSWWAWQGCSVALKSAATGPDLTGPGPGAAAGRLQSALILARLQVLVAASPLLLYLLLAWFAQIRSVRGLWVVSQIVFPILAILGGLLGGVQFPIASRVFFVDARRQPSNLGSLYALDLLGASIGAVLLSVYLVPVFGFLKTALLSAVVNLAPASLAYLSIGEPPVDPA